MTSTISFLVNLATVDMENKLKESDGIIVENKNLDGSKKYGKKGIL